MKSKFILGGHEVEIDTNKDYWELLKLRNWFFGSTCAEWILENEIGGITDEEKALDVGTKAWANILENYITGEDEEREVMNAIG